MTVSLDDLLAPPTSAEVREGMYAWLDANGCSTTLWIVGAVLRAVVAAAAMFVAGAFYLLSLVARMGSLSLATGDWLTLCARYNYGIERSAATFAEASLALTNAGGGIYDCDAGEVKYASSTSGAVYANVGPFSLGAHGSETVLFRAVQAGSGSTTAANTITVDVSGLANVTATNPLAAIGLDAETDAALLLRCQQVTESASPNGPADAYRYAAVNATLLGVSCGVTRVTVLTSDPTYTVTVLVAGASGGIDGSSGDPSTPLGAVYQTLVADVLPLGATLALMNGYGQGVAVDFWVYLPPPLVLDTDEMSAAALDRLGTWMGRYPIGGVSLDGLVAHALYREAIKLELASAVVDVLSYLPDGTVITVNTPATDVTLGTTSYPVIGAVTMTEP